MLNRLLLAGILLGIEGSPLRGSQPGELLAANEHAGELLPAQEEENLQPRCSTCDAPNCQCPDKQQEEELPNGPEPAAAM